MITMLNTDCMAYMSTLPDKAFELAIVGPPYGIGENGDRNASRCKLAIAKDYKPFSGMDLEPPPREYFTELMRVSKTKSSGVLIILFRACLLTLRAGLYGTR
jgi:site-specific DNA-methyltransferase (adenine-specific)